MIGALHGPWLLCAALLLLAVAIWRRPRPDWRELWLIGAIVAGAAAARLIWGVWGPLHVNGQGPLWIRGALAADALSGYGPGYFELFGWVTGLGAAPERAIFAANALLSALGPALLYAAARLAGVERGGALAVAVVLAADAASIRTAASEGYYSALIALVLGVEASLALWVRASVDGDRLAALALGAACLLAAAAARLQPMSYLPLALSPLVVLCAAQPEGWTIRLARAVMAGAAIGATVVLTSGNAILDALHASEMTGNAFAGLTRHHVELLLALCAALLVLHRWLRPPWLPVLGILSLLCLLATQTAFQQHPLWNLCYQRVFWPGLLLGAAPLFPRRPRGAGWALAAGAAVAAVLAVPALPYFSQQTTEQLEHQFLAAALRAAPPDCTLAAVSRAGYRVWEIPSYLVPASGARGPGAQRALERPSDLRDAAAGGCLLYVHSSLCNSAEGRAPCGAVEREARLERVASTTLPAVPSYVGLPYDVPQVEVIVYRAVSDGGGNGGGDGRDAGRRAASTIGDGAAITPDFAQSLYERLSHLNEADGCRLVQFDTSRFRITVGLQAPSGAAHTLELATDRGGAGGRTAGPWALAVPPELERDCGASLAAIERVLIETAAPTRSTAALTGRSLLGADPWSFLRQGYILLVATFILLVLGTGFVLARETRVWRPPPSAVAILVLVWAVGLALRLWLSPHTFLHEYYHVAETLAGYLTGDAPPAYGKTGPALFRLVSAVLGRSDEVEVIFVTTAVIASLAIPAVALLALELTGSWPQALCAGVFLCVLPQHLRFSAAEDLFVQSVSFAFWALALFALYIRTRRLADALLAALALSLAVQTRPEMLFFPAVLVALVLLVKPREWRVLVEWRTLLPLLLFGALLVPRLLDLRQALSDGPGPTPVLPSLAFYRYQLVLLYPQVTPVLFWAFLVVGLAWGLWRTPGLVLWVIAVFLGYTLFPLSLFANPQYNLRSQLLPTSFLVLIASGAAPTWLALWGSSRRLGLAVGAAALALLGFVIVSGSREFITELRDQQLEWAFLARTVAQLPEQGTLLTAVEVGGMNLDGFPDFLLNRAHKTYAMVDVRRAAAGDVAWPAPGGDLLFYQGMFCYFATGLDEPAPESMTAACTAVHDRFVTEPLFVEDLDTQGYSVLRYANGPYRIGFYRLKAAR